MLPQKRIKWWISTAKKVLRRPDLLWVRLWYNTRRTTADILYIFGINRYRYRIVFLAGMALGATTWIKNLFARVPGYYTRPDPMPEDIRYNQDICDSAFSRTPKMGNTLFKTHLNPTQENVDCIFRNDVEKVIVSYRDLRDVAISRYHRLVNIPKDKSDPNYVDYEAVGKEAAIDHSIDIIKEYYEPWILGWMEIGRKYPDRVLFVKFEDLKADTKGTFKRMLAFYEIGLPEGKIDDIIKQAKGKKSLKQNIHASKVLPFAVSSNFRKGGSGYWKTELTERQIQRCKELLGESLIALGYEKDLNWSGAPLTEKYSGEQH
ncbi:MAG: sulfotransferase domain-containing protein [Candidatus Omnitrophica bacterium]|nr:sulfotransferase domain-containing protein [Candidatus Omnitrophota bacterium]